MCYPWTWEAGHPETSRPSWLSQQQSARLVRIQRRSLPRVRELDESLARLSRLEPEAAARLGELAVVFVEADGVVQVEERELLALVGAALDLSIKPTLNQGGRAYSSSLP